MTFEQLALLNLCLGLTWLGGAILFARANRPKEPYQLRRVPRAAGAFVAGHALIAALLAVLAGQFDIIAFHLILIRTLIIGMLAFLSVLIVDVLAMPLGATRTPIALAAGIAAALVLTCAWLFLIGLSPWGAGPALQLADLFTPGLLAAAAAVIWWSELPRPDEIEADIFD